MLIRDETITAGYRLRIIDMDFSLLADQPAPWHGDRGYFGTPGYLSPEHLRGEVPQPASDVFTLGLMLHELLGKGHPYQFEDEEQYHNACMRHAARPIELYGSLVGLPNADQIRQTVHRCLAAAPSHRPRSKEVQEVLNGLAPAPPRGTMGWKCPKCGFENDAAGNRCGAGCGFVRVPKRTVLASETTNQHLRMHVSTLVGKVLLMRLDPSDAIYASEPQFEIIKDERLGAWAIRHHDTARNPTYLNGERLDNVAHALAAGGIISIGPDRLKLRVILEDE
jgi:hypothetical protein